jgi:hypothetical protein
VHSHLDNVRIRVQASYRSGKTLASCLGGSEFCPRLGYLVADVSVSVIPLRCLKSTFSTVELLLTRLCLNAFVFWAVTQRMLVYNRRFGITNRFHLQGSSAELDRWRRDIGDTETSVMNQLTLRNNPEDGVIQFNRAKSQRSRKVLSSHRWESYSLFEVNIKCELCKTCLIIGQFV